MFKRKVIVCLSIIILLLISLSLIQTRAVNKIQEQFGVHLNQNVNILSIFGKGVKSRFSMETLVKQGSEKLPLTRDELLKLSGSAETFSLQTNSIQVTEVLTGHFKVLSSKLYELAKIIDDPTQQKRKSQLNEEILFLSDTMDKAFDLI